MTQAHRDFISYLARKAPLTAAALERHWEKGEQYYIDSRVNIKGVRRLFNHLNKQIGGKL